MANHMNSVHVLRRDLLLFNLRAIRRRVEEVQHLSQGCFLLAHHSFLDHIGAMLLSIRADQVSVRIDILAMVHELRVPSRICYLG